MNYRDIGQFLKILREEQHISQETAAAVINVSDRTIRNIETGRKASDMVTLFKLCDLYQISGSELWQFYQRDEDMQAAMRIYHLDQNDNEEDEDDE